MFTKAFWIAAFERGVRTGAQAVLLSITGGILVGTGEGASSEAVNAFLLDWVTLGGVFLGGFILAVLTALTVTAVSANNSPSITNAEVLAVPPDGDGDRRGTGTDY